MRVVTRVSPVLLLLLVGACAAADSRAEVSPPPLVRVVATGMTFTAPSRIDGGRVRVRLVNEGEAWHEVLITRLPPGTSVQDYLAGARAGEDFPAAAVDHGGPGIVAPGDSSEVVLDLAAGEYAIVCWTDNHVMAGMIAPLAVSNGPAEAADVPQQPVADGAIALQEFAFAHAEPLRPGPQLVRVRNEGQRPHDLALYRLAPGRTLQDFGVWYATREGPAPATPIGGTSTLAPGRTVWLPLSLTPGHYFMACGTPEGDQIHAQLGMIEEFEIRGAD